MALYVKKGSYHYSYMLPAVEYYFIPNKTNFSPRFPFIQTSGRIPWFESRRPEIDYIEPYNVSMTLSSPLMIFIMLLGALLIFRARPELKILFYAFGIQAVSMLFFHVFCVRYQMDFVPAIFVMSIFVLSWVGSILTEKKIRSLIILSCLMFIVGGSIYLSTITMLSYTCPVIHVPKELKSMLQAVPQQNERLSSFK